MNCYVLVRGPLGVGKTTVSKRLAELLEAEYVSVDQILEDHGLWSSGRLSEFLRVNALLAPRVGRLLKRGRSAIIDGNFYWKTQIKDLEKRLDHRHFVFTLVAPLGVCIERDRRRVAAHGSPAARTVYAKSTRFDIGTRIDATRPIERTVREISSIIAEDRRAVS